MQPKEKPGEPPSPSPEVLAKLQVLADRILDLREQLEENQDLVDTLTPEQNALLLLELWAKSK